MSAVPGEARSTQKAESREYRGRSINAASRLRVSVKCKP